MTDIWTWIGHKMEAVAVIYLRLALRCYIKGNARLDLYRMDELSELGARLINAQYHAEATHEKRQAAKHN